MNKSQDFVSGLLYCIFAALSLPASILLIISSAKTGNVLKIVSSTIYGTGLILLLLFSTLNKWLLLREKGKRIFRKFNHIFIYFFIATTYIPLTLVGIQGAWGWSIFGVIIGLTILCIVFNSIWVNYPKILYSCIYIALGLIVLLPIKILINNLNLIECSYSIIFLFLGDFVFTVASIIYAFDLQKHKVILTQFFNILVLAGLVFHYWFIFRYILAI